MNILFDNKFDYRTFINDHNFNIDHYLKFYKIYYTYTYNTSTCDPNDFNMFELLQLLKYNKTNDELKEKELEKTVTIPDEFYDPISCILIHEPCLLPNMTGCDDTFFDKNTILKYLLIKQENPYTRAVLTTQEFIDFNETEHTRQKIAEFKERLDKYIK